MGDLPGRRCTPSVRASARSRRRRSTTCSRNGRGRPSRPRDRRRRTATRRRCVDRRPAARALERADPRRAGSGGRDAARVRCRRSRAQPPTRGPASLLVDLMGPAGQVGFDYDAERRDDGAVVDRLPRCRSCARAPTRSRAAPTRSSATSSGSRCWASRRRAGRQGGAVEGGAGGHDRHRSRALRCRRRRRRRSRCTTPIGRTRGASRWSTSTSHASTTRRRTPDVRAIVVTGAGSAFCPGMDMAALEQTAAAGELVREGRRPMHYALSIPKPMIAAINGACAGIGLIQALYCDLPVRGARRAHVDVVHAPRPRRRVRHVVDAATTRRCRARPRPPALGPHVRRRGGAHHGAGRAPLRSRRRGRRRPGVRGRAGAVLVAARDGRGPLPGVRGSRRRLRDLVGPARSGSCSA